MKTSTRLVSGLLVALIFASSGSLLSAPALGQSSGEPDALLERAEHAELVLGDIDQAITIYRRISESPVFERVHVARALLGLGTAYELTGNDTAVDVYSRIVREYADQSGAFLAARKRLSVMGGGFEATTADAGTPVDPDYSLVLPNLTDWGGREYRLYDISPDGKYIVMPARASEDRVRQYPNLDNDLLIVDRRTGNSRPLLEDPGTHTIMILPRWSPDGRFILYRAHTGHGEGDYGKIYLFDMETETSREAGDSGLKINELAWFPDSRRFLELQRDGFHVYGLDGREREFHEWSPGYEEGGYYIGSIHPDGTRVAFSSHKFGNWDILIYDFRTSETTQLTTSPFLDMYATWSADGSSLYFSSNRMDEDTGDCRELDCAPFFNIYRKSLIPESEAVQITSFADASASRPTIVPETGELFFSFNRENHLIHAGAASNGFDAPVITRGENVALSPDGEQAYFVNDDGDGQALWRVGVGESQATLVLPERREFLAYSISPDGSEIVRSTLEETTATVSAIRPETGETRINVTRERSDDYIWPSWSPDGLEIAYVDGPNLNVMPWLGGEEETLVSDVQWLEFTLTWSPDGRSIAGLGSPAESGLRFAFVVDRSTNEVKRLTPDRYGGWIWGLSWHPSGRSLAFLSSPEEEGVGLFEVNIDGGPVRRLVELTSRGRYAYQGGHWGPDARYYFRGRRHGDFNWYICAFDPVSDQVTILRDLPSGAVGWPVWSRDGSVIGWHETEFVNQLWMLTDYE